MNKELLDIDRELRKTPREINASVRSLDGWADRIMGAICPEVYTDYPKSNNGAFTK